ncbi:MAG: hypothetical protein U0995_00125 [Erythrobacter sp.]|nr:hypothetical protein [Erythrobacter sp.]MDZ4273259.1 hypothetical protein [Erythrobacter sp.]MDZ4274419.1 hypothetical protein [Erythrobacter sp.]
MIKKVFLKIKDQPYKDILASMLITFIFLLKLYFVFYLANFDVNNFTRDWIVFPFIAMTLMVFLVLERENIKAFEITLRFIKSPQYAKVATIFLIVFLIWALGRSMIDWIVEPEIVNYGPCPEVNLRFYSYEDTMSATSCGIIDENLDSRWPIEQFVDRLAIAIFILIPTFFISGKFRGIIKK